VCGNAGDCGGSKELEGGRKGGSVGEWGEGGGMRGGWKEVGGCRGGSLGGAGREGLGKWVGREGQGDERVVGLWGRCVGGGWWWSPDQTAGALALRCGWGNLGLINLADREMDLKNRS